MAAAERLLDKGIDASMIVAGFNAAVEEAVSIAREMSNPVDFNDTESLVSSCKTSLSSKVVSQYSNLLAPIAVNAVMNITDPDTADNVDLRDIRVVKKVGGTIDESKMVKGIVLTQKSSKSAGGPSVIENAKIGLIQFQLSSVKPNVWFKYKSNTRLIIKLLSPTSSN